MNEKELEKYGETLESWMSLSGDAKDECIYRYPAEIRIQADIARQLTIANEIARMQAVNSARLAKGQALAYSEEMLDGEITEAKNEATPTPDALVGAVKEKVGNFDMLSAGQVFNILDEALAAITKEKV